LANLAFLAGFFLSRKGREVREVRVGLASLAFLAGYFPRKGREVRVGLASYFSRKCRKL